jgi:early secretory antigenic target protein ESAT-6
MSNPGEIHVNFGALEAGQAGINKTYGSLQATLDQLESDLKPMIETWSGDAQQAYLVNKQQWDQGAAALAQVLNNIGRAVGDANENYQATHQATKQIWT